MKSGTSGITCLSVISHETRRRNQDLSFFARRPIVAGRRQTTRIRIPRVPGSGALQLETPMSAAPIEICDQSDREAWLEARKEGIGSSDAPAILGLEKAWGTPYSIACSKRGLGDEVDFESELMKWGRYVEAPMLRAFADETGHEAKVSGMMFRRNDPDLGFMTTTLDGAVVEKSGAVGGAECKLSIYTAKEWEIEGVPEHVLCQCQHTMAVMDWDFLYVLALLDGYRLRYKRLERDDEILGDVMIPAEREWWAAFQDGAEFDAGIGRPNQSAAFLKSLHPSDDGTTISLKGDHFVDAYDAWKVQGEIEKIAKKSKEQAKNTLVQGVGGATFAILDDGRRVSLKTTDRSGYEAKASTFRTLRSVK